MYERWLDVASCREIDDVGGGGLVHDKQNQAGKVKNGNRLQDIRMFGKKKSEVQIIDLEKIIYRLWIECMLNSINVHALPKVNF